MSQRLLRKKCTAWRGGKDLGVKETVGVVMEAPLGKGLSRALNNKMNCG